MQSNQILKIYGTEFRENTKMLLEAADLSSMIPGRDARIAIKPNLVSPSPASYGATTHPEIVAGIIEYLQENGFEHITILEGSWVGDKTQDSFLAAGYDRICRQYSVPFFDTQKDTFYEKDCGGLTLKLCSCTKDIDFLINVPVLKGHCQTKITCALKNLKGLIPNTEKRRFHSMGLHRPIAHLAAGIRQDFIVADHICGDLDFEDGGNPVVRNGIFAAVDPVLLDSYVCYLLHYSPQQVPYIPLAAELGCGSIDLNRADIRTLNRSEKNCEKSAGIVRSDSEKSHEKNTGPVTDTAIRETANAGLVTDSAVRETANAGLVTDSAVRETANAGSEENMPFYGDNFLDEEELPYAHKVVDVEDAVEEVESCSACYGYLIPALDRLRQEGLLDRLPDKICIGQGWRGKKGSIGVGNCTAGFDFCVRGCPPTETEIYEALKSYLFTGHGK